MSQRSGVGRVNKGNGKTERDMRECEVTTEGGIEMRLLLLLLLLKALEMDICRTFKNRGNTMTRARAWASRSRGSRWPMTRAYCIL